MQWQYSHKKWLKLMWKWWMNSPFLLWFFFYLTPCVTTSRHPVKPWAPISFVPLFFYIRQVDFICGCCRIISISTVDTVVVIMWPLAPLRLVGWCCQSSQDCYQTTPHPTNAMVIPLILNSLFCDTKHISINPHQSMFRLFPFFLATLNLGMKATPWACVISLMKVTKHSSSLMPRRTRIQGFLPGQRSQTPQRLEAEKCLFVYTAGNVNVEQVTAREHNTCETGREKQN